MYMLATLEPAAELTGGPWYTDKELDTEFIKLLCDVCLKIVTDMHVEMLLEVLILDGKIEKLPAFHALNSAWDEAPEDNRERSSTNASKKSRMQTGDSDCERGRRKRRRHSGMDSDDDDTVTSEDERTRESKTRLRIVITTLKLISTPMRARGRTAKDVDEVQELLLTAACPRVVQRTNLAERDVVTTDTTRTRTFQSQRNASTTDGMLIP
ncbi:hypothetical protein BD414DRAFT_504841 [Trametes punicea]|nr:hypothetical protein BD414DRAFT_504841 [Trametes punicea]